MTMSIVDSNEEINVNVAVNSANAPPSPPPTKVGTRNLFVNGLAPDVTDAKFMEWFARFGTVQSAKVMLDVRSGISRGFGFILFENPEDCAAAMTELQGKVFGMSALQISPAQHDGAAVVYKSPRILVRNLPLQLNAPTLLQYFTQFGNVVSCLVRCDTGHSNGKLNIATVTYDDVDAASKAVDAIHGNMIFPECEVPLLAKAADLEGSRKEKARKAAAASGLTKIPSQTAMTKDPPPAYANHAPMMIPMFQPQQQQQQQQQPQQVFFPQMMGPAPAGMMAPHPQGMMPMSAPMLQPTMMPLQGGGQPFVVTFPGGNQQAVQGQGPVLNQQQQQQHVMQGPQPGAPCFYIVSPQGN